MARCRDDLWSVVIAGRERWVNLTPLSDAWEVIPQSPPNSPSRTSSVGSTPEVVHHVGYSPASSRVEQEGVERWEVQQGIERWEVLDASCPSCLIYLSSDSESE